MRANIEATEPQMTADIARLYHEMINQNNSAPISATRSETPGENSRDLSEDQQKFSTQIADRIDAEEGKLSSDDHSSILSANSARLNQSVDLKSDKFNYLQPAGMKIGD